MKSCLTAVSTFLAAICALLFVFLASLSLCLFLADRLLLSPGVYKQALVDQEAYARMPAWIAEQIIYQQSQPGSSSDLPPQLKRLSQSDWELLIAEILTPPALQTQAESVIDQLFTYLNTPAMPLKVKVSLVDFKAQLDSDAGYRAAMRIIAAQPACSTNEWNAFFATGSYQFEDIPFCRPPDEIMAVAEPYIRAALHTLTLTLPSETYLDSRNGAAGSAVAEDDRRPALKRVRGWILLSMCLPVGLFALIAIFGVRSVTGGGLWLGLPLVGAGALTFIAALITWRLPDWLIANRSPGGELTIAGLAPGVTQALVDVVNAIIHSAARTAGLLGILLILLGLGILIAGFLFGMSRRVYL